MYKPKSIQHVPFANGTPPPPPVRGSTEPTGVIRPLESPRVLRFSETKKGENKKGK